MIEKSILNLADQGDLASMISVARYYAIEEYNADEAEKWADKLSATLNIQALSSAATVYKIIGNIKFRVSGCMAIEKTNHLYDKALLNIKRIEKLNGNYEQKDEVLKLVSEIYILYMHNNYEKALEYLEPVREKGSPFAAYLVLQCHNEMGKEREVYDEDIQQLEKIIENPDIWPNNAMKAAAYLELAKYHEDNTNISNFCVYAQKSAEEMNKKVENEKTMYAVFYKTYSFIASYGIIKPLYNYYKQEINKRTSLSTGECIVIIIGFLWWIIPGIIALVYFQNKAKDNRNKYPVTDEDIRTMKACMDSLQQSALNTGILKYLPQNVITPEQFPGIYEQYEREYHWS